MRPTRIRAVRMKNRIVSIIVAMLFPFFCMAQHMDFFGITMGQSLENFEKCLVENGVVCSIYSEGESIYEDEYLRIKFYSYSNRDRKYTISVECTKYSKQVYRISVSLVSESEEQQEEFLQRALGRVISTYDFNKKEIEDTLYRKNIKLLLDRGSVNVGKQSVGTRFHYSLSFVDQENILLSFAEHENSKRYNKEVCKKLQDKYNNPLFYDKNPRF